jgi:hypothetical protein
MPFAKRDAFLFPSHLLNHTSDCPSENERAARTLSDRKCTAMAGTHGAVHKYPEIGAILLECWACFLQTLKSSNE